jgi:RHS repeat-associated protein
MYGAGDLPATYVTPLGATTRYAYDEDAQLKTLTRPGGDAVTITRDAAGRMGSMTTAAGETAYAYDAAGRLGSVTAPGGVGLAYTYDGDLATGAELTGPVAGRVDRTYDADFRTAGVSVNGGAAATYAYDADGLLTAVGAMTLARDAANGQVTGTALGVVADERTYNEHGEPTGYRATAGGTPVLELAYTRDGVGRITGKTETIQGVTANYAYSYDVAGRLVRVEKNGTAVEQYTYDANGNRTSGTAGGTTLNGTYDGDDKVLTYGGAVYGHAAGGEWRTVTEGGATTTYDYDSVGNLRTVTLPSGTTLEYVIDGRNRRVGRKVNGVLTKGYLYDGQLRVVAELDGANNITARYVYGTRTNVPEWLEKGGAMYRIITDHLGSLRLVVNTTSGAIIQRMDYDSWGNITNDTSPGFQIFGYAGGLHDPDTKLTRFGARDYDARTGRWTAKDPIGFNGGDSNVYQYAQGDPINLSDPLGLFRLTYNAGFHIPITPGPVAAGPNFASHLQDPLNPESGLQSDPTSGELMVGSYADIGVSAGFGDLSNTNGGQAGATISFGSGRYGGVQFTLRRCQDKTKSIFNPLRYIDGFSFGINAGVGFPVQVSIPVKVPEIEIITVPQTTAPPEI